MAQSFDGPVVINGTLEITGAVKIDGDITTLGVHNRFNNGNIFIAGEYAGGDVRVGTVNTDGVFCRSIKAVPNAENTVTVAAGLVCEGHFVNTGGNIEVRIGDVIVKGSSLTDRLAAAETASKNALDAAKSLASAVATANALSAQVVQLKAQVQKLSDQQTQQLSSLESQIGQLASRIQ
jgi:hypothetical protein